MLIEASAVAACNPVHSSVSLLLAGSWVKKSDLLSHLHCHKTLRDNTTLLGFSSHLSNDAFQQLAPTVESSIDLLRPKKHWQQSTRAVVRLVESMCVCVCVDGKEQ